MKTIGNSRNVIGIGILLAVFLAACGGDPEEGAIEAEQSIETDAPGRPALPGTAVEEPDPEDRSGPETGGVQPGLDGGQSAGMSALTDQSQVEARQRGLCETQRPSHPGEDFRVECTRAVTGDDRRESWQCTCVWGG